MLKVFADRGGTFTDIVAITNNQTIINRLSNYQERFLIVPLPNQEWIIVYKLLSENPEQYQDAVIQGIRDILGISNQEPIPSEAIEIVKMGTTVATNALLERKGNRVVLAITKGFKDALRIGYQNRPSIFARQIILPTMLYEQVIEIEERYDAHGQELIAVNIEQTKNDLKTAYDTGIRSCAIVFMHSDRYPNHEQQIAQIAQEIGFTQISTSHQVSPLMKLVSRGDTTVVDAYLTPILRRYVNQVASQLPGVKLMFMKSDGGLTDAEQFQVRKINLKYDGTNSTLNINFADDVKLMRKEFETEHKNRYGFTQAEKPLIVESVSVEVIQKMDTPEEPLITRNRPFDQNPTPVEIVKMFTANKWHDTPVYRRDNLQPEDSIIGPAIIVEKISTIVVEPHWKATLTQQNHLILQRHFSIDFPIFRIYDLKRICIND